MNREDIIRLAEKVGLDNWDGSGEHFVQCMEHFAALVAAHEREQCAKVCEKWVGDEAFSEEYWDAYSDCAKRIRERGEQ